MEALSREAWAQAVAWAPTVLVALGIFLAFSLLSRAAHFGVLRIVRRTRGHGPLGVNISGMVAGLGLTGFALGFALKDSIANPGKVVTVNLRYTELDAGAQCVLVPNSRLLTDPIRVTKARSGPTIQDL